MEYKHFSHQHYLTFQQLQNGPPINCSGCKSPVTGSIYICWQCSFFLHEQCYQASRALNHHSHPSHPLTLIPYPTYPSGSFICNSCNQTGTGFSFSCSNCDFDLHVHCAYNPQTTPHESSSYPFGPTQNYSASNENQTFHSQFPFPPTTSTSTHESYPNVPPNLNHQSPPPLYPPTTTQESHPNVPPNLNLYPSMPNNNPHESSYPNYPNPNHSLPNETPTFNAQYPSYYIPQSVNHEPLFNNPPHVQVQHPNETVLQCFNAQMGSENSIHGPNFQNPVPSFISQMGPQPVLHQSFQNMPNEQNPPPCEPVPSFNAHTVSGTHVPNQQQILPNQTNSSLNAPTGTNQPNVHQHFQNMPKLQHPSPYETVPSFNPQTRPENTEIPSNGNKPISATASGENQQKLGGVKHFSHDHALLFSEIKEDDGVICSGCEQKVSGSAYTCTVSNCNFKLHNSCFGLPRELKHKSHPEHSLSLLSIPPYKEHHQFACNACLEEGSAFVYNCSTCNFDLHVHCAFLPETVVREDHKHSLTLLYSFPFKKADEDKNPDMIFTCDVCRTTMDQRCWFYYCQDCDFGTHLSCVTAEQCPEEEEQPSEAVSELAMMLETQAHLQRLQIQMDMSRQNAQFMARIGQSINLV